MRTLLQKLRRNKKGFTLVEVIVVLVIIVILAAITVPALVGYISDAQDKTAISEARTAMVAAQKIASEKYAVDVDVADISTGTGASALTPAKAVEKLTGQAVIFTVAPVVDKGAIKTFTIEASNKKFVTYTAGADEPYTISDTAPSSSSDPTPGG